MDDFKLAEEGWKWFDRTSGIAFGFKHKPDNSWQATCPHHDPDVHPSGSKTACTKTLKISGALTEDIVLKLLKEWCHVATDPSNTNKDKHQKDWDKQRVKRLRAGTDDRNRKGK